VVEPEVNCPDDDANDAAFVQATSTIGGWDAIKEFMACKMYPLASSFGFKGMTLSTTPVSKVRTLLSVFPMETFSTENGSLILAEVGTEAKRNLGSFWPKDYDALTTVKLPNGGRLNCVFEQTELTYVPGPLPDSEANQAAKEKRKVEVSKNPAAKRAKNSPIRATPSKAPPPPSKTGPPKKISIVKIVQPRAKPEPQGTSEIELALTKPVGVSKFFCLLDVPASSRGVRDKGPAMTYGSERTACVMAFNNLGDDSFPDVRKTPSPKRTGEKRLAPLPSISG
jgi:hypothetical protein